MSDLAAATRSGIIRRVPLAPVAAALVAGIIAGRYLDLPTVFYAACGCAGLAVAAVSAFRRHLHAITCTGVAAAIFCLGAAHVRQAYFTIEPNHIATYAGPQSTFATVRGQVITSPVRYAGSTVPGYRRPDQTGLVLRCRAIRTGEKWSPANGLLRVMVREPADHLAAGQDVELIGSIGRFRPPPNPGQFDRAAAGRLNHILAWMTVPCADGAIVLSNSQPWYSHLYWNLRAATRQHLAELGQQDDARVLAALVVGERDPTMAKLNEAMVRAGVAHFLSISGLHLGVFLGFAYLLCRAGSLTPRRSAILVLIVLVVYLLLAEPRAPLLRSAIMAAALCAATIWRRRYSAPNALAAAAVILLAVDPLQLFTAGFQLSFVIVAAMVVLHRPLRQALFGRWLRRRGLVIFRTDQPVRRWMHYALSNRLMDAVALALLAYLAAAPLVAYHFGLFSPYAAPLSLLLFPLVAAVLVPGYLSMALLWPLPGLSYAVGRVAAAAAGGLSACVEALTALPGLAWELRPLPAGWVVLCYAALLLVALRRQLPLGRPAAVAAVLAVAGWGAWTQLPAPAPPTAELHLLAVGNGQCAVLRTPSGRTVLFDAGTQGGYDAWQQVIAPMLRDRRLPAPSEAFLSHANTDHYNALESSTAEEMRRLYVNEYFGHLSAAPTPGEAAGVEFLLAAQQNGTEVVRLTPGRTVTLDEHTSVEVLWPPPGRNDLTVNDTSLVLRVTCNGQSVLLTGDLDETGQTALLAEPEALACDAMVLPHHGGWEPTLPEFVAAANPEVVLVSCGSEPRIDTRATAPAEVRKAEFYRQLRVGRRYHATHRDGWICLRFDREKLEVQTMR